MKKIIKEKVTICECLRCGHIWKTKRQVVICCAKCKTPYWQIPRLKEVKAK